MKNKVLTLFLTFIMMFSIFPATTLASQAHDFADMPDNWSTNALIKAVDNGLLKGYTVEGKSLIKADTPLKRAEMAAIVNRAFGAIKTTELIDVTDVPSTAWYAMDMAKAVMMGTFMKDTNMRPENSITRQEAFAVLARAFKVSSDSVEYKALEDFSDKADIAKWAKKDLNAMVEAGYVQGSNGKLNPNDNISRAEFATVMDNLVKQYIDIPSEVTDIDSGNVLIRVPGVTLKNLTIEGDLIIADGVGEGDVTLDNVKVEGRTVIRGGGENSIIIKGNSGLGKVILCKAGGKVQIAVEGTADVKAIYIDDGSDDVLVEGIIGILEVAGDDITAIATKVILTKAIISGDNSTIILREASTLKEGTISGTNSKIIVDKGATTDKIIISSGNAKVKGKGTVKNAEVKAGGDYASITTPNTKIDIAKDVEGVTAAGGAPVEGGTRVTNNDAGTWIVTTSSSRSGNSSSTAVSAIIISTIPDVSDGVDNGAVVVVTLTTSTSESDIYYTLDGSIPTTSSMKYTAPLNVDTDNTEGETITIKAIGIKTGYKNSAVAEKVIVFNKAKFAGGDGTPEDPYQVATAEQLNNVRNHLDKHFIQIEDIDLGVAPWNQDEGWLPIGNSTTPFRGNYNGNGKIISNLTINRAAEGQIGLFGSNSGTINKVSLIDVQIIGYFDVGGLAGVNDVTISNCFTTGSIVASGAFIGGLIGSNSGSISNSYSTCNVNAQGDSSNKFGGLIGSNHGTVINCYSIGCVNGVNYVGGLIGFIDSGATVINSYWDTKTSGQDTSAGGTGYPTSAMIMKTNSVPIYVDWDFDNTWVIEEGFSYPYLKWQDDDNIPYPASEFAGGVGTSEDPYQVATAEQLNNVRNHLDAYFIQTDDIDLSGYNAGAGWMPIGNTSAFTGNYYGAGYTISNLMIERTMNLGLFCQNEGVISNVSLSNANVTGFNSNIGGLVGYNKGTVRDSNVTGTIISNATSDAYAGGLIGYNAGGQISGCYSGASVSGVSGDKVGGLIGSNGAPGVTGGLITNSYAMGTVTGENTVGGLTGANYESNEIINSYATGIITGTGSNLGGLIGWNGSTVTNSYWDMDTSGMPSSAGGEGKTTEEMKQQSTFSDWDFDNVWAINTDPASYPYLQWQE